MPQHPWECTPGTALACGERDPPAAGQSHAGPGWGRGAAHKRGKGTLHLAQLAGLLWDVVLASDVVFELFDDELLLDNNCLDKIANRDEADQPPAVQDR